MFPKKLLLLISTCLSLLNLQAQSLSGTEFKTTFDDLHVQKINKEKTVSTSITYPNYSVLSKGGKIKVIIGDEGYQSDDIKNASCLR